MNLKKLFLNHCKKNNLEINLNQLELVDQLNDFYNLNFNKSFLKKIFSKKIQSLVFIYKEMWVLVKL
jgi:cell division protein ZapE